MKNVALAIDGLKAINLKDWNLWNNGALKETGSNAIIGQYTAQLEGLNAEQAKLALSTTALTEAQKNQILVFAGLAETSNAMSIAEVKQIASTVALSSEKEKEILATLQGALVEGTWNEERLKAIALESGEAATIAKIILARNAETASNVKNVASLGTLNSSLGLLIKQQLIAAATNPFMWVAGGIAIGAGLIAIQEKLTKTFEESSAELKKSSSAYESAASSVESLENELETCKSRLKELQDLADSGKITITEQDELDKLKLQNEELERSIRLEKEKQQIAANESVKSASETLTKTVESKYEKTTQYDGVVGVGTEVSAWVAPEEELKAAISEYDRLSDEIKQLKSDYDSSVISQAEYEKQIDTLKEKQGKARERAYEMSEATTEAEDAFKNLTVAGGELTAKQQAQYDSVKKTNEGYIDFLNTIDPAIDKTNDLAGAENKVAEANENVNKNPISFNTESLTEVIGNISSIQSEYDKFKKNIAKGVSFTANISDIEKLRKGLVQTDDQIGISAEQFEAFENVVTSSTSSVDQIQSAYDNLATDYLYASGCLEGLTSSTRDQIVSQLELNGIANASKLITKEFAEAMEKAAKSGLDLSTATASEIRAFVQENQYSTETKNALAAYTLAKITANGTVLSTDMDIQNLIALVDTLGGATTALQTFNALKGGQVKVGMSKADYDAMVKRSLKEINDAKARVKNNAEMGASANSGGSGSKNTKKETDVLKELNAELDKIQDAYSKLIDIRDTFNKTGKITIDQYQELTNLGFNFLAQLVDENGQLNLNENAFRSLTDAKIQELQIQMARNALDTINGLKTETEATEYLTYANVNLRNAALGAAEAMLYQAQSALKVGTAKRAAADMIVKGYENSKLLAGKIDISGSLNTKQKDDKEKATKEKEEKQFNKTYNWFETLLNKVSKKLDKLTDSADRFFTWWKKNAVINKVLIANASAISANEKSYAEYMKLASKVKLDKKYVNKIKNGSLTIEDITDESLSKKIDEYNEYYDNAQKCMETVEELYNSERNLIRQKLDNVIDYYSDLDSYLSSVTSKVESLISLNDSMGKRSSLTELVEEFASISEQLENVSATTESTEQSKDKIKLENSQSLKNAVESDRQKQIDAIEKEINASDVVKTGTYQKLLSDITKAEDKIKKYEDNGWDTAKEKQYNKLKSQLQNYYDLQKELDENATSNTVANYSKVYQAYQKLQAKIDGGKDLSKSEQKKYDTYLKQIDAFKNTKDTALSELEEKLSEAKGEIVKTDADKLQEKIDAVSDDLVNSATYSKLIDNIKSAEKTISDLEAIGYENLSKKQKSTYDKLTKNLQDYYDKKEAYDKGATSDTILEYDKIYTAWKKLQDELDKKGKFSSAKKYTQYEQYTQQLQNFVDSKQKLVDDLNNQLDKVLNPADKLENVRREYEDASSQMYDSYRRQIGDVGNGYKGNKIYQSLSAEREKLIGIRNTKGLSASQEAKLKKYEEKLEALQNGAMVDNIDEYSKVWDQWYALEQKRLSGKKYDATKYDTLKAQLDNWNKEKQEQIDSLTSEMEDALENLDKEFEKNTSEATSEVSEYYGKLYELAKQIAEYNIDTLETQLSYIKSCVDYYSDLVSLYDKFSGDKLTKLLGDLGYETDLDQLDVYTSYLEELNKQYDATLSEMNEYKQLLQSLDTNDFASSMELFDNAINKYNDEGNTAAAEKLQAVLNLLNERAVDADNWGEYADKWETEWEQALNDAKSELISTAGAIQDVNDSLRAIRFSNITDAVNELSRVNDIISSITSLINDDWAFDDNGMTEYGQARVGLLVSQLENAQTMARDYLDLYNQISADDTYASEKEKKEALDDALSNYYSSLSTASSIEASIVSAMKNAEEKELDSLKKVIDARKKALQTMKDYYDYAKTIKTQTSDVEAIKAQIDALEQVDTAEAKSKLAQLEADLKDAQDNLQNTKDDHVYNLQIDALDELVNTLEDALNDSNKSVKETLEDQKKIVASAIELYNSCYDGIQNTLNDLRNYYGGTSMPIGTVITAPSTSGNSNDSTLLNTLNVTPGGTSSMMDSLKDSILVGNDFLSNIDANLGSWMSIWDIKIPDFSKLATSAQSTTTVNIHYDNMINVEGSVDAAVISDLKQHMEDQYDYTKSRLTADLKKVGMS